MPHRGKGSSKRRADGYFAIRRERQELLGAMGLMEPERPNEARTHRIVSHGAGRAGLISEWRASDDGDDHIGAIGIRREPERTDTIRRREKAALGDLECPECHKPITTPDLDALRDTSRNLGIVLPTARHLACMLALAKTHRNLAKRGELICTECNKPVTLADLDKVMFAGRHLGRALSTDMHVECQVPPELR